MWCGPADGRSVTRPRTPVVPAAESMHVTSIAWSAAAGGGRRQPRAGVVLPRGSASDEQVIGTGGHRDKGLPGGGRPRTSARSSGSSSSEQAAGGSGVGSGHGARPRGAGPARPRATPPAPRHRGRARLDHGSRRARDTSTPARTGTSVQRGTHSRDGQRPSRPARRSRRCRRRPRRATVVGDSGAMSGSAPVRGPTGLAHRRGRRGRRRCESSGTRAGRGVGGRGHARTTHGRPRRAGRRRVAGRPFGRALRPRRPGRRRRAASALRPARARRTASWKWLGKVGLTRLHERYGRR